MSDNTKSHVDTASAEFKQGVEAGLNSPQDTDNWQAGNELGQELKDEPVSESPGTESANPLFTRDSPSSHEESLQDEKDETEE